MPLVVLHNRAFGGLTQCIRTAELGEWSVNYPERYCVSRLVSKDVSKWYRVEAEMIETILKGSIGNYPSFRMVMEEINKKVRHSFLGDFFWMVRVSDPLFFLHIRNIDRLWAEWQARNPANAIAYGSSKKEVLNFYGLHPNVEVKDVMSTKSGLVNGLMCYEYVPPQITALEKSWRVLNTPVGKIGADALKWGGNRIPPPFNGKQ